MTKKTIHFFKALHVFSKPGESPKTCTGAVFWVLFTFIVVLKFVEKWRQKLSLTGGPKKHQKSTPRGLPNLFKIAQYSSKIVGKSCKNGQQTIKSRVDFLIIFWVPKRLVSEAPYDAVRRHTTPYDGFLKCPARPIPGHFPSISYTFVGKIPPGRQNNHCQWYRCRKLSSTYKFCHHGWNIKGGLLLLSLSLSSSLSCYWFIITTIIIIVDLLVTVFCFT